ncbi:hypothetical protein [Bittarella sp. HCP28S3_D9]|uniref:portal protein n=1 Tax=Bittarella sp. HCP28S3_D9 TaxID=3440253 RepID=UPI003F8C975A
MIATEPAELFREYRKGIEHKERIGLYETVRQNENFYLGKQWEGVNAPDLDKPVFNVLGRVLSYFLATIVSDDVAAQVSLFDGKPDEGEQIALEVVSQQFAKIMEQDGTKAKNRLIVRNAAVDGDGFLYAWFDPEEATGQEARGQIKTEVIENTDCYFGNTQRGDIQSQPWVAVVSRLLPDSARRLAPDGETAAAIVPDGDGRPGRGEGEEDEERVTVLTKFWKVRTGGETRVFCTRCTETAVLKAPFDTGLTRYPLAGMSWQPVKDCCHGRAAISGLIPNQIFINKLMAMCMEHAKRMAFPKIVYSRAAFPNGWDNRVGVAVAANGNLADAVTARTATAEMPAQVMTLIDKVIGYTKDLMGASDAALGNVRPDNTSAIIAVQKASSVPLELQRMAFYQFVEDTVRIFLDMMRAHYGTRRVLYQDGGGEKRELDFDFSLLGEMCLQLNVDVGASTYWSELMQVQTVDNLFARGIITDPVTYLESIPDGYIRNKAGLIAALKQGREGQAGERGAP